MSLCDVASLTEALSVCGDSGSSDSGGGAAEVVLSSAFVEQRALDAFVWRLFDSRFGCEDRTLSEGIIVPTATPTLLSDATDRLLDQLVLSLPLWDPMLLSLM